MININLLPWRKEQRNKQKIAFFSNYIATIVLTIILMLVIHLILSNRVGHQNRRNAILQNEIQATERTIAKLQDVETEFTQTNEKIRTIEKLYNNRYLLVNFMNNIDKILTKDISLTEIDYYDDIINLSGLAPSNAAVAIFMEKITNSNILKQPNLKEITVEKTDDVVRKNFSLQTHLKNLRN